MIIKHDGCRYHNPCFHSTYLVCMYYTGGISTVKGMYVIERSGLRITKFIAVIDYQPVLTWLKKILKKLQAIIALYFDILASTD